MYLKRRHRKWWAYYDVPARLREAMDGTKRLARTLGTDDRREAERRAQALWLHDWQPALQRAERGAPKTPSELERDARFWRGLINRADTEEEKELLREQVSDEAEKRAEKAMRAAGVEDPYSPEAEELQGVDDAVRFAKLARGELVPLLDHVDAWLATTGTKPKTQAMQRADLERLSKSLPMVSDVTPEAAQRWVYDIARERDLSAETLKRMLSGLRNYWTYLAGLGLVPRSSKPFSDLTLPTAKKTPERKDFGPEDVVRLHTAAEASGNHQLADLIALGMFTGARREELCALGVADVALAAPVPNLTITDAKTRAGKRTVPVHPDLLPTLQRLVPCVVDFASDL